MSDELDKLSVMEVRFEGGKHDGLTMTHQFDEVAEIGYFTCDGLAGRYKQVFVPLEMEHPAFIG